MSGLISSFIRGNGSNNNTNERNGTIATGRRSSVPAIPTTTGNLGKISPEEWQRRLQNIKLSRPELDALVMNYLVIEGYKDAAEKFSREAGVPGGCLGAIDDRMYIRSAIQRGDIDDAVGKVNDLYPDLLDGHPRIAFHLQQQRIVEMLRVGRVEEALESAQEELASRSEGHPEFLRDLERTMTLLVFGDSTTLKGDYSKLMEPTQRVRIANEVNAALLAISSQDNESKLPLLIRLLHNMQESLGSRTIFPKIVDYSTTRFEPSLE